MEGSLLASVGLAGLLVRRNLVFSQEETLPSDLASWALDCPAVTVLLEVGSSWGCVGPEGIEGAIRPAIGSVGWIGEVEVLSALGAMETLVSFAAKVLSGTTLLSGSEAMSFNIGLGSVPSLSTGADTTRSAINLAVNDPIGEVRLSAVDDGSTEPAGSGSATEPSFVSVVVVGSKADSSVGGTAGPTKGSSTEIGSILRIGSRAGGSDSSPDVSPGASTTPLDLRFPSCLVRLCSAFCAFSSSFLALALRFSSSIYHQYQADDNYGNWAHL